jgi:glycosyltransferase involved in cell wall biosynthesis
MQKTKILQINTTLNSGSTGRIAEDIGLAVMAKGYTSFIAAGFSNRPSQSEVISIGSGWDRKIHGIKTRLFDKHGFGSANATRQLVKQIAEINPDIIHLHNLHGYYINVKVLFEYLKTIQKPVVWTFHDCWPFTGHCSHFERINCMKWQTECYACANKKGYPASWIIDNSTKNYHDKKRFFNGLENLHIVTPSKWLEAHVGNSFLKNYPVHIINNGINLEIFKPVKPEDILKKYGIADRKIILGVANTWKKRKALADFIQLSNIISGELQIVLVGMSEKQIKDLPKNITGIPRTESIQELAALYSAALVFVNPTYVDNFPTTNIEALACGTSVITYKTGGSPEAIDEQTGFVVEKGNIEGLVSAIDKIREKGKTHYAPLCRARAEKLFNKEDRFGDYLRLYRELVTKSINQVK